MDIKKLFFNTEDFILDSKKIGEGTFGTVYLATNIKNKKKIKNNYYSNKLSGIYSLADGIPFFKQVKNCTTESVELNCLPCDLSTSIIFFNIGNTSYKHAE